MSSIKSLSISLLILLFSLPYHAQSSPRNDNDEEPTFPRVEKIVYRANMTAPEDVERTGGFLARGMDGSRPNQPPLNTSLWNHATGASTGLANINAGYVSTTSSRSVAINWVYDHLNHNGYVYYIAASGNFVNVNNVLRHHSPHPAELEYAALGRIQWRQILGWRRVRSFTVGPFQRNRAYNMAHFNQPTHPAEDAYELAGFPDNSSWWGDQPWVQFSNCELRHPCSPNKSSYHFAESFLEAANQTSDDRYMKNMDLFFSGFAHGPMSSAPFPPPWQRP